MIRFVLLLVGAMFLAAALGCGQPTKGVNKDKDMPVAPDKEKEPDKK
ncbi:MAG: hypothetical protein AB7K24_03460 [Gemmataceae bacterium]